MAVLLFTACLLGQSELQAQETSDEVEQMIQERLFMPNAWADWVPDPTAMKEFVEAWTSRTLNGCGLQIPWDRIEPEAGEFVWNWLDERLDIIVEAGLRVHLRLATQNHRPGWVDMDFITSFSSVAATLGNIGPGFAGVGAVEHYGHLPHIVKGVLTLCMLLGRLEIYTVLVLLVPSFWKK